MVGLPIIRATERRPHSSLPTSATHLQTR